MKFSDLPIGKQAISDQDEDYLEIDKVGAMTSMKWEHHQIHEGNLYSATHKFDSVSAGSSVEVVGITDVDVSAHLLIFIKAGGEADIEFEKGTTFTDVGTSLTVVNRNENSSNTAATSISHSPTTDTAGTVFSEEYIPGGGKQNATIGGEAGIREEYIVAPNSKHLLRVTNQSPDSESIFVKFIWYEV